MELVLIGTVVGAILYYIGREVIGSFRHPEDEELLEYWEGITSREDRSAYRRISEHLATCTRCRDRLDDLRKQPGGPGAKAPMIQRKY